MQRLAGTDPLVFNPGAMTDSSAAAQLESEGAKLFEVPIGHAAQRTVQAVLALILATALFQASLFVPGVARALGVSAIDGAIACGLVILGSFLATGAYKLRGLSRLYFWAEYTESSLVAAGYSYLIYASGTPQSFFWFLYLIHVFVVGSTGANLRNGALFGTAPATVALGFGLRGQLGGAVVSLVAGGFGVMLYVMVGRSFDELEAVRRREAELKGMLARLRVAQERDRIARDLHDGVGAQLAGLVWRVRGLATGPASTPSQTELETLERRVLDTIEEVHDVVLALRREHASWDDTVALLTKRCQEMCGSVAFRLSVEGAPDPILLDAVFPDLIRIVLELVRNAARHSGASTIEVRIQAAGELRLSIIDNGRGLPRAEAIKSQGGLRNVHRRVEDLSGSVDVASDSAGTRIDVVLPKALGGGDAA